MEGVILATLVDSYSAFRNLILTASVGKTKILSKQEVEATVKHFANTFFRHYNVYEVAFTTERVPLPIVKSVVIDTALPFPSLADGEEVAAPKAQKEAEEDEEEVSAAALLASCCDRKHGHRSCLSGRKGWR